MSLSKRDEMKLDNAGQIITSEIQVKAREDVPRGTERKRDRREGEIEGLREKGINF